MEIEDEREWEDAFGWEGVGVEVSERGGRGRVKLGYLALEQRQV